MTHILLPLAVLAVLAIVAAVIKALMGRGKTPADYGRDEDGPLPSL